MSEDKNDPYYMTPFRGMPPELRLRVESLSPVQRKYCEFRVKGLKQADACEKAGSEAKERTSLGKIGWSYEQMPAAKDYLAWLHEKRAKAACVDDIEIITNLRAIVESAMASEKYSDAVKATELLGNMIGVFSQKKAPKQDQDIKTKNNINAFKEEEESNSENIDKRMEKIHKLMMQMNNQKDDGNIPDIGIQHPSKV